MAADEWAGDGAVEEGAGDGEMDGGADGGGVAIGGVCVTGARSCCTRRRVSACDASAMASSAAAHASRVTVLTLHMAQMAESGSLRKRVRAPPPARMVA